MEENKWEKEAEMYWPKFSEDKIVGKVVNELLWQLIAFFIGAIIGLKVIEFIF